MVYKFESEEAAGLVGRLQSINKELKIFDNEPDKEKHKIVIESIENAIIYNRISNKEDILQIFKIAIENDIPSLVDCCISYGMVKSTYKDIVYAKSNNSTKVTKFLTNRLYGNTLSLSDALNDIQADYEQVFDNPEMKAKLTRIDRDVTKKLEQVTEKFQEGDRDLDDIFRRSIKNDKPKIVQNCIRNGVKFTCDDIDFARQHNSFIAARILTEEKLKNEPANLNDAYYYFNKQHNDSLKTDEQTRIDCDATKILERAVKHHKGSSKELVQVFVTAIETGKDGVAKECVKKAIADNNKNFLEYCKKLSEKKELMNPRRFMGLRERLSDIIAEAIKSVKKHIVGGISDSQSPVSNVPRKLTDNKQHNRG